MQSACSGGTGTFIEKTARKLQVATETLAGLPYAGMSLHKVSSKCGIFAETDANTLVKTGVPVEEIIASLFEAVVYQNLATLTKGNTPSPEVLLLGGPNLFFRGLQEAWRHHLAKLWEQRKVVLPDGRDAASCITVPAEALYYACLGCVEIGAGEPDGVAVYEGRDRLRWWVEEGQQEQKAKAGGRALVACADDLQSFVAEYDLKRSATARAGAETAGPVLIGCDFGSTTAKAVVVSARARAALHLLRAVEGQSDRGRPVALPPGARGGLRNVGGARADRLRQGSPARTWSAPTWRWWRRWPTPPRALHFHPDADVICDVGGTDVKIMILRQGTVADFRLNSQCSSGNGAFLQGVAERYVDRRSRSYAESAFEAKAMPTLAMGCGVFLQSDIVNQQRKGWAAEEIMAALAAVLPVNVWIYAGQLQNLRAAGRKFVLQGGTHRNMAVVKAQVDFIRGKVPEAEVVLHPYSGEAGAIGAALCAADWRTESGRTRRFRGFETIAALTYTSTTAADTVCKWCPINCTRTFIDVQLPGGQGPRVEQAAPGRGLGAGHQRQLLPEGAGRGRERDAGGEGEAGGGQA